MNIKKQLVAIAIKCSGDWNRIFEMLVNRDYIEDEEADQLCNSIKCKTLTILDADYPQYLKNYYQPPFVLFYYGDISLIQEPNNNIAVVGSRDVDSISILTTRQIISRVAKEYVVVSGLARGIDRISHEAAIFTGGKTIGVLGCGIDICYPSCNEDIYSIIKNHHLLISEYCNKITPDHAHFPQRNRLIAMFSSATFVPSARLYSGTSITVNYSISFNHPVYCLPSSDYLGSLCNELIRDGAVLVRNADDLLYELQK